MYAINTQVFTKTAVARQWHTLMAHNDGTHSWHTGMAHGKEQQQGATEKQGISIVTLLCNPVL